MRDLLTGIAVLVILGLSAAFAAPLFVDWNAWRSEAEQRLSLALGRNVRIGGDLKVRFLPQPRLTAANVTIRAAQAPASLAADHIDLELSLAALLRGELRITEGVIDRPVLTWRSSPPDSGAAPGPPRALAPISIERLSLRNAEFNASDADGRPLFAARGDFDVEAAQLEGPWKAQGRADIGGRRYDIRWSSGLVDAEGRAALKLTVQDASLSFIADADGALAIDRAEWRQPPRFEGRVTASGTMPWPFGKFVGEQPWRLTATGAGELSGFTARELEFEAGPQDVGVKADGEGALLFVNSAARGRVTAKLRPIDIDRLIAVDPGQLAPPLLIETAADAERFLTAIPFPIEIDVELERAFARGESFGPIKATGRLESGRVTVDRAEAQAPGGLKALVSGQAWIDSEPALETSVNLTSTAPAKAWSWLSGASLAEMAASQRFAKVSSASAIGRLRWRPGRLALDDVAVTLDGAKARVSVQRRFATQGDPGRIGVDVRADRLDLDLVPPLNAIDSLAPGPDVSVSVAAREVVATMLSDASLGSLEIEARQQGGVQTLSRFALKRDGLSFVADGVVKNGVGRFATELVADDLRPLAVVIQRAFPGAAANALAARAAILSPARLQGSIAPSRNPEIWLAKLQGSAGETRIDAHVEVRSPKEDGTSVSLESLRAEAQASDAGRLIRQLGWRAATSDQPGSIALTIASAPGKAASFGLSAALAGTQIEASGQAIGGLTPTLSGVLRLNGSDIRPLLRVAQIPGAGAGGQPARLESQIELGLGGLHLQNVSGTISGKSIKAASLQMVMADEVRATGRIELAELSLSELTAFALGVEPEAGAGGVWSSARFPAFTAWPIPFDIELRAPKASLGFGWGGANVALRLISRPDGLRIESGVVDIASGKIGLSGTVRRDGGLAAITGRVDVAGLDLAMLGATGATGLLDLSLDIAGNGDAVSRLIAGLGGAGSSTLRKFSIARLDPNAAKRVAAAHAHQETLPAMAALTAMIEQELGRAPFTLAMLSAPVTLANGVARIGPARAESDVARIAGSAQLDIRTLRLDARGAVAPRAPGDIASEFSVVFAGPLASPRRTIDAAALFSDLTQKAAAREADRIKTIEQDQRERASFNRRLRVDRERADAESRALRDPARTGSTPPPSEPTPLETPPPQGQ